MMLFLLSGSLSLSFPSSCSAGKLKVVALLVTSDMTQPPVGVQKDEKWVRWQMTWPNLRRSLQVQRCECFTVDMWTAHEAVDVQL